MAPPDHPKPGPMGHEHAAGTPLTPPPRHCPAPPAGRTRRPLARRPGIAPSILLFLWATALSRAATPEPAGRLGYWRFNSPDCRDEAGRPPLEAVNRTCARSFDGLALNQTTAAGPGHLRLARLDPAGGVLLAPVQGAVRFLYKPHWATPDLLPRLPGSTPPPPGHWLRLFEAGSRTAAGYTGHWMISIDPGGTNLIVHARDAQGRLTTNFQARIGWTTPLGLPRLAPGVFPTEWHEIVLNYNPATCSLVIDGAVQQDWSTKGLIGPGLPILSGIPGSDPAFSVGSTLAGELPAEGLFDELETYDRPVSPLRTYASLKRTGLHASVLTSPPTVTLAWFSTGNDARSLRRTELGQTGVVQLATNLIGMSFTDTNNLRAGASYMYQLGDQNLIVGLNQPPTDQRGRVIVLVDRTLAANLRSELAQLQDDLVGDGWTVVRHDVPRHNDAAWTAARTDPDYRSELAAIKSLVAADYRVAPDSTAAVLLVGHVTIPYSGAGAEDGHMDHFGAWPADAYYGDLDGDWTDSSAATQPAVQHPLLRNVPGDGKFDQTSFPKPSRPEAARRQPGLDLAVGRIDFARLPAFGGRSERELLRQYLAKNHRYRHKQLTFGDGAIVGGYFGNPYHVESSVLYDMGNLLAYRLYRPVLAAVRDGNAFAGDARAVWAVQGGYGDPTSLHNSAAMNTGLGIRRVTTADLAAANVGPRIGFYVLKGSYFGDWNYTEDNFLRAALAAPESGLAAFWVRHIPWPLDLTGLGEPLAAAVVAASRANMSVRNCSVLGDPTLRPFVTAPAGRLTATRSGRSVRLAWEASPEAAQGYLVYRSATGSDGPFVRLKPAVEPGTTFTDAEAPQGRLHYQVRACQLLTTGCGTFTNTSQGVTVELRR